MTTTTSMAIAAVLSLGLVAPVLAAEDITEHETYEKRSLKIETGVAVAPPTTTPPPSHVYEHHDSSESTTVEKHATTPPPAPKVVVKERSSDSVETMEKK